TARSRRGRRPPSRTRASATRGLGSASSAELRPPWRRRRALAAGLVVRVVGQIDREQLHQLSDTPRLGWSASRLERRLGAEHLRDTAEACIVQMLHQRAEQRAAVLDSLGRAAEGAEVRPDVRAEQPWPDGALVICAVALRGPAP